MGQFNLPPGCSTRDIDRAMGLDEPCDCCGHMVDDCICPECSVCGEYGNPNCYGEGKHIKEYSADQMIGQAKLRIDNYQQLIQDEEQAIAWLEQQKQKE